MKQWWQSLNQREQYLVSVSGAVVLLAVLYWGLWSPLVQGKAARQAKLEAQQDTLIWAKAQGERILASGPRSNANTAKVNVNQAVSSSARQQRITLSRIQPQGEDVEVWIDEVIYSELVEWLGLLNQRYQIEVLTLDLEKMPRAGMVKVKRLRLGKV